jgi:hypothetical protein
MSKSFAFKDRPATYGAVAGLATCAAFGAVFLAPSMATAERAASDEWISSVAILGQPATAADALPSHLVEGEQALHGLEYSTTRSLGQDESGIAYWVGVSTSNELCLITALPGDLQLTGMTCATADDFETRALGGQTADKDHAVAAYLLPDSFVNEAKGENLNAVSPNLIVAYPYEAARGGASLPEELTDAETGAVIDLPQFDEIDRTFGADE